jgi:hypothetical protein
MSHKSHWKWYLKPESILKHYYKRIIEHCTGPGVLSRLRCQYRELILSSVILKQIEVYIDSFSWHESNLVATVLLISWYWNSMLQVPTYVSGRLMINILHETMSSFHINIYLIRLHVWNFENIRNSLEDLL